MIVALSSVADDDGTTAEFDAGFRKFRLETRARTNDGSPYKVVESLRFKSLVVLFINNAGWFKFLKEIKMLKQI